jgi:hypothetical protein
LDADGLIRESLGVVDADDHARQAATP